LGDEKNILGGNKFLLESLYHIVLQGHNCKIFSVNCQQRQINF
jgi:hypothetical protein